MSRILVVAGEVSGDMHAAGLIAALKQKDPDLECFGIGGDNLRALGVEITRDASEMAALGFIEVLPKYFFFMRVLKETLALARERKPDAILLVDYPGFNLRFAEQAKAMGFKIVYYICPQVWAWHKSRIGTMAQIIDRLITIFPFEPPLFEQTSLKTDYAGHPLLRAAREAREQQTPELPWQGKPQIAILPGSRRQEVERNLPVFLHSAERMQDKYPDSSFIIASPSTEIADLCAEILSRSVHRPDRCEVHTGETRQVLKTARAAMTASGTATLETALMRCPMIIGYKVAAFTYLFARYVLKLKQIGMVNIVAGREVCREFLQHDAEPEAIAEEMCKLIEESPERASMLKAFEEVAGSLEPEDAYERAAAIVQEELTSQ